MNNFSTFPTFVLRTPLLPVSYYTSLLEKYSQEAVFETLNNAYVKNAIALASPELLSELEKHRSNPLHHRVDQVKQLEISLLKYIARLTSRATPFGLFAGCNTGHFSNETNVRLLHKKNYSIPTQFDMQFWTHLLQELGKETQVREKLVYFPNSSLYSIGSFYRYVEYKFVNKRREHTIAAVRKNPFVTLILEHCKTGKSVSELVSLIIDNEAEREEATSFIHELIDNQLLVSNLEATVTGDDEINRVLAILKPIPSVAKKTQLLEEISEKLIVLENNINAHRTISTEIIKKVKQLEIDFDEKYLLQTDLHIKTKTATVNTTIARKLQQAISFLERLQSKTTNANLEAFKKAFLNRYETKEMPLAIVLDSEVGIGYLQGYRMNDSHPILDSFSIAKQHNSTTTVENWSKLDYLLEEKIRHSVTTNEFVLHLKDEDFKDFSTNNNLLPPTFSAMIEIFQELDQETLVLDSLGNFSATKLIGRFCNGEATIHDLAKEIVTKEAHLHPTSILAEIAHLPESRTGNVLRRPLLRTYEIPYLANSIAPKEQQIEIEDLLISVVNKNIVLKSKQLNKIIIPCLSNAHNYSSNALPIYQFLCDLQGQNTHPVYKFDWGILKHHYNNFPRVVYKEVILAKAKWYVYHDELKTIAFGTNFEEWKAKKQIPRYVTIVNGDNTLLINLEKEICFEMMQKTAKSNGKVLLEEFLFTNESVVKDEENNNYANQFIVSFYRE
ncbi:hypothetical protein FIA58_011635 [Flavobacterium jejuense]|uniref:Lantibiotic dehydratase N-terminal domain-containing protein n=1 Tax=Flavobacterium jejuense TaxID=1544455 RepID=A0ABX0IRY4_9FLAO|nr:lantibiotic dehydratase family protein [Flavobacterium jejuense]NHN26331.1 hypothetical protein [Flavobacterium jejuense]